jgi:CHASE2 domain-containing sensor protein
MRVRMVQASDNGAVGTAALAGGGGSWKAALRTLWSGLGAWFGYTIVALVIYALDPFGLSEETAQISRDVANRIMAPSFPDAGREPVSVVLLDDAFTDQDGVGWPIPYDHHADTLFKVAHMTPRAIFIDFIFKSREEDPEGFDHWIDTVNFVVNDLGIPTVIATALVGDRATNIGPLHVTTPAADAATPMAGIRRRGTEDGPQYASRVYFAPVVTKTAPDRYPLVVRPPRSNLAEGYASPVLLLTHLADGNLCAEGADDHPVCRTERGEALTIGDRNEIWVQWPVAIPPDWSTLIRTQDCRMVAPSTAQAWGWRLTSILGETFRGVGLFADSEWYQNCPPIRTVTGSQIAEVHNADNASIRPAIEDKIVFIGGNFSSVFDHVASPVHGLTAGVYWHATAMANLLAQGESYRTPAPVPLIELSLLVILTGILVYFEKTYIFAGAELRIFGSSININLAYVLIVFSSFLIIIVATWLAILHLNSEPINYMGLMSYGVAIAFRSRGVVRFRRLSATIAPPTDPDAGMTEPASEGVPPPDNPDLSRPSDPDLSRPSDPNHRKGDST